MKLSKSLLASSLALAFAASAHAATVIHIAGSTAYRAAVIDAIEAILSTGYTYAYVGSSVTGSSQAIFKGTLKSGGTAVEFKTSFEGSVGGVADLVQNLTVGTGGTAYPSGGGGWIADSNPTSTTGTVLTSPTLDPASTPDVAMSDSFQASTPFKTPALSGKIVGVVPFEWVKGLATSLSSLTNITTAQAYSLLKGSLTGGTGNAKIYAVGRDEDSGTRLAAYEDASGGTDNGDIGAGPYASVPKQYTPVATGTPALWPAPVTVDGFTYSNTGHSGYAGGGPLASAINISTTNQYVAYLGLADAKGVNSGNNGLEFNSHAYTASNVETGAYAFWGYEHFLYRSTLSGTPLTVAQALETEIPSVILTVGVGVPVTSMSVHRNGDGQAILAGGTPPNTP